MLVNLTDTIKNNEDSILVPISALKVANAKMTELKYQRDLNNNLYNIIHNDSIIINSLKKDISVNKQLYNNKIKQANLQRNIAFGVGGLGVVLFIISLFK